MEFEEDLTNVAPVTAGEFRSLEKLGVVPIIQMGILLSIVFYGVVTFLHHYWGAHYWHHHQV